MQAIVTIFKAEFQGKSDVLKKVQSLSVTTEVLNAYVIVPDVGNLYNVLNMLKENNINYGTHFNTTEQYPNK